MDRPDDFLFFWDHTPEPGVQPGVEAGPWVLSQWWPSPFEVDGVAYATAEHFMMAEKALLFGDEARRAAVLASATPAEAKQHGREVAGFDHDAWVAARVVVVRRGSAAKFDSDDLLLDYLLGTGSRVLVEASPDDLIWGIGLSADDPRASDPAQWPGANLLGSALMHARDELRRAAAPGPGTAGSAPRAER